MFEHCKLMRYVEVCYMTDESKYKYESKPMVYESKLMVGSFAMNCMMYAFSSL